MEALMGLLADNSASSTDPKEKINAFIITDKGDELRNYLKSLEKGTKEKILSNSITKFGENVPLRQAIHHRSLSCIRALILSGAEVSLADGAKIILARNVLLYKNQEDADLARIVLQSYEGSLGDLPFASTPPPGTCFAMLARSHSSAWRLLPILALKGMKPVITPVHDDMAILAQAAQIGAQVGVDEAPSPSSSPPDISLRKCIYEWIDAYYSTNHHHSLKNRCRIVVRKALRVADEATVDALYLPQSLKDYLLLRFVN